MSRGQTASVKQEIKWWLFSRRVHADDGFSVWKQPDAQQSVLDWEHVDDVKKKQPSGGTFSEVKIAGDRLTQGSGEDRASASAPLQVILTGRRHHIWPAWANVFVAAPIVLCCHGNRDESASPPSLPLLIFPLLIYMDFKTHLHLTAAWDELWLTLITFSPKLKKKNHRLPELSLSSLLSYMCFYRCSSVCCRTCNSNVFQTFHKGFITRHKQFSRRWCKLWAPYYISLVFQVKSSLWETARLSHQPSIFLLIFIATPCVFPSLTFPIAFFPAFPCKITLIWIHILNTKDTALLLAHKQTNSGRYSAEFMHAVFICCNID